MKLWIKLLIFGVAFVAAKVIAYFGLFPAPAYRAINFVCGVSALAVFLAVWGLYHLADYLITSVQIKRGVARTMAEIAAKEEAEKKWREERPLRMKPFLTGDYKGNELLCHLEDKEIHKTDLAEITKYFGSIAGKDSDEGSQSSDNFFFNEVWQGETPLTKIRSFVAISECWDMYPYFYHLDVAPANLSLSAQQIALDFLKNDKSPDRDYWYIWDTAPSVEKKDTEEDSRRYLRFVRIRHEKDRHVINIFSFSPWSSWGSALGGGIGFDRKKLIFCVPFCDPSVFAGGSEKEKAA